METEESLISPKSYPAKKNMLTSETLEKDVKYIQR